MRKESVYLTKIFVCFGDFAHTYTHKHTHTHTHKHTHIHTYKYIYTHTQTHASKQASWSDQKVNLIYNAHM